MLRSRCIKQKRISYFCLKLKSWYQNIWSYPFSLVQGLCCVYSTPLFKVLPRQEPMYHSNIPSLGHLQSNVTPMNGTLPLWPKGVHRLLELHKKRRDKASCDWTSFLPIKATNLLSRVFAWLKGLLLLDHEAAELYSDKLSYSNTLHSYITRKSKELQGHIQVITSSIEWFQDSLWNLGSILLPTNKTLETSSLIGHHNYIFFLRG